MKERFDRANLFYPLEPFFLKSFLCLNGFLSSFAFKFVFEQKTSCKSKRDMIFSISDKPKTGFIWVLEKPILQQSFDTTLNILGSGHGRMSTNKVSPNKSSRVL